METPIATKRLTAQWTDGTRHDVCVQIWPPTPDGRMFRCRITTKGLQPEYDPPSIGGFDEMQAITLSLSFVRFLFEEHLRQGGSLYYPSPESDVPYSPHDLPPATS
ncbi:MAG: hypothetical protein JNN07_03185 [Verrucomicrobiales bacterium]|nr:hypothetical protein [Verrucomicrobiales bacterium]